MPRVRVLVTLKPTLLDAQGRTVQEALHALGYQNVNQVRIGKVIEMDIADETQPIEAQVREMCDRLLANPVTELYEIEVLE
ncbi:MAG: phosphoribosylformylglycinamidine synthase subunit PurS [Armatimonadota bacterium]|nr:phosphoribosylformylglycinamidine synthase subunit PurS [bacterium]MDW8320266.1 phosphoribosylformylglycinamidine synthase subunit PurS [Armatimonadota bacterium]